MNTERRVLLATVLSVIVFVVWTVLNPPQAPRPTDGPPHSSGSPQGPLSATGQGSSSTSGIATAASSPPTFKEELTVVTQGQVHATFSNLGGTLASWGLDGYHTTLDKKSPWVDLIGSAPDHNLHALGLVMDVDGQPVSTENLEFKKIKDLVYASAEGPMAITKTYTIDPAKWWLNVRFNVRNRSQNSIIYRPSLRWQSAQLAEVSRGFGPFRPSPDRRSFLYSMDGKVSRIAPNKDNQVDPGRVTGPILWAGVEERYFLAALVSRTTGDLTFSYESDPHSILYTFAYPERVLRAGDSDAVEYSFYLGPKVRETLVATGAGLDKAIDYGIFSILALPILQCMRIFHTGLKNWGLAIIALTVSIRLLMNPLTVKGLKSMKAMGELKPQLDALRDKFKGDKQRLNAETMQLFKRHGVNPMGGCLPMLLQMPIYLVLYKVLYSAIELHHAPFFGFYKDLSAPDPYFIMPVLLGLFMFLQQHLSPTVGQDQANKMMMKLMPVMFSVFMLFLPSGLVLYILVSTVLGVTQQWKYQKNRSLFASLWGKFNGTTTG